MTKKYSMQNILTRPLNIIPFSIMKQVGCCKLIILYYHAVNNNVVPHISQLYDYKNVRQFCDDLEFLTKHYSPINLLDAINWVNGRTNIPPNSFLLTFDDGFREIHDIVAPILHDKGIPATVFINSAFLDNKILCYQHKASLLVEKIYKGISIGMEKEIKIILEKMAIPFSQLAEGVLKINYKQKNVLDSIAEVISVDFNGYLNENQPYLTSNQVMTLINKGLTIGAHSINHPYYSTLSLAEQLEQTMVSVKFIREIFDLSYGAFAFPHNDTGVSLDFFKTLQESGLVDITFGTGGMLGGSWWNHLQRVSLEKPVLPARQLLTWQYARKFYYLYKRRQYRFLRFL